MAPAEVGGTTCAQRGELVDGVDATAASAIIAAQDLVHSLAHQRGDRRPAVSCELAQPIVLILA